MIATSGRKANNQSGDTLVEVLLATVILSIIVTSCFTLITRASRINQTSAERSEAVGLLQQQAESLKFHSSENDVVWKDPTTGVKPKVIVGAAPTTNVDQCQAFIADPTVTISPSIAPPANTFHFDDSAAAVIPGHNFNRPGSFEDRYEIWINGYRPGTFPDNNYIDFYINACWQGIGTEGMQRASMVYRLVDAP